MNVASIRKAVWHHIDPVTASVAGVSVQQLQQFVAGTYQLANDQLRDLARHLKLENA